MANDGIGHDGSNFNLKFDREVDRNIARLSPYMDFADYGFFIGFIVLVGLFIFCILKVFVYRKFHQEK